MSAAFDKDSRQSARAVARQSPARVARAIPPAKVPHSDPWGAPVLPDFGRSGNCLVTRNRTLLQAQSPQQNSSLRNPRAGVSPAPHESPQSQQAQLSQAPVRRPERPAESPPEAEPRACRLRLLTRPSQSVALTEAANPAHVLALDASQPA